MQQYIEISALSRVVDLIKAFVVAAVSFVITVLAFIFLGTGEPCKIDSAHASISSLDFSSENKADFLKKVSLKTKYLNEFKLKSIEINPIKVIPVKLAKFEPLKLEPIEVEPLIDEFDPNEIEFPVNHSQKLLTRFIADAVKDEAKAESIATIIVNESERGNVDPFLIASIIFSESTFRTNAYSKAGAVGLMQLLPHTAKYISSKHELEFSGTNSLRNPLTNVRLGIAYLKYLQSKFRGNLKHALIAYNWGPGNLIEALQGKRRIPAECINYSSKISNRYKNLKNEYKTVLAENEKNSFFS